jgi:hypothetical protein
VYLAFDLHDAKETEVEDLESAADLIGTNAAAALAFDHAIKGVKLLEALNTRPHIRKSGALYRPDGQFFALYLRPDLNGRSLGRNRTVLARPSGLQEVREIIET